MCEGHVCMVIKIVFTISIVVLDSSISFQKCVVLKSNIYQMIEMRVIFLKFTWFGPHKHLEMVWTQTYGPEVIYARWSFGF